MADSVAEEPVVISQLVRFAGWGILLLRLERALSLTAFTESQLASLQKMAETAERPQAAVRAVAGEQACGIAAFTDPKVMATAFRGFQPSRSKADQFRAAAFINLLRITGLLQRDKAFYLDNMRRQVAAFELPYPARFAAGQQLAAVTYAPNRFYIISRMILPALQKFQLRDAEHVAPVRVAAAVLAIERFRLAHANALPENLEQLTPACFKTVRVDPYHGKPLRYKTHGSRYAVYCVGSDGQDDGGVSWDSNHLKAPQDIVSVVKH